MPTEQPPRAADVVPLIYFLRRALAQVEAAFDGGAVGNEALRAAIDEDTEHGLITSMGWRDLSIALAVMRVADLLDQLFQKLQQFDGLISRTNGVVEEHTAQRAVSDNRWAALMNAAAAALSNAKVWQGIAAILLVLMGAGQCNHPTIRALAPLIEQPFVLPPSVPTSQEESSDDQIPS